MNTLYKGDKDNDDNNNNGDNKYAVDYATDAFPTPV